MILLYEIGYQTKLEGLKLSEGGKKKTLDKDTVSRSVLYDKSEM